MTLMQKIKDDQLTARKEKSWKAMALTTLLGEAAMIGKNDGNRETTDPECVAVIKKFIKNMEDTAKLCGLDDHTAMEIDMLNDYLPKQMENTALVVAVQQIVLEHALTGPRDMGTVMKLFKEKYDGQYDGKELSVVVKGVLK